jgi:hypothetical protein
MSLDVERITGPGISPTVDPNIEINETDLHRLKQLVDQVVPPYVQQISSIPDINTRDIGVPSPYAVSTKPKLFNHTFEILHALDKKATYCTNALATQKLETGKFTQQIDESLKLTADLPYLSPSEKVPVTEELRQKLDAFQEKYGITLLAKETKTFDDGLITKLKNTLAGVNKSAENKLSTQAMVDMQELINLIKTAYDKMVDEQRRAQESGRDIVRNQKS